MIERQRGRVGHGPRPGRRDGTRLRSGGAAAILALFLALPGLAEEDEIHDAVKRGDLGRVETLLAADPELRRALDDSGRTPFHWAVLENDTTLMDATFTDGLLDERDAMGLPPVILAMLTDDPAALRWLIAKGVDCSQGDRLDVSPLHWGAEYARTASIELLLEAGVEVDAKNAIGSTPLLVAAKFGHADVVRQLLAAGAEVDRANAGGVTPLILAASRGHAATVQVLLAAGADPENADRWGKTALDYAVEKQKKEVIELLRVPPSSAR